jgi:hypothetical protein
MSAQGQCPRRAVPVRRRQCRRRQRRLSSHSRRLRPRRLRRGPSSAESARSRARLSTYSGVLRAPAGDLVRLTPEIEVQTHKISNKCDRRGHRSSEFSVLSGRRSSVPASPSSLLESIACGSLSRVPSISCGPLPCVPSVSGSIRLLLSVTAHRPHRPHGPHGPHRHSFANDRSDVVAPTLQVGTSPVSQGCQTTGSQPWRTASPHRTAPHRTAPHRTAPHRTAPHRTGSRSVGRDLRTRSARIRSPTHSRRPFSRLDDHPAAR